jgi:hypothetical protein
MYGAPPHHFASAGSRVKHNTGTPRRACSSAQGTSFRGAQTWVHCDLTNGTSCPARSGRRTATRMIAALGERAHDMAAEEARAAEDGDERIGGNCVIPRSWGWAPAGSTLICCAPASREYGSTQPRNIRRTRFLALTRSRGTRMNATAYICGQTNVRFPESTHSDYRQQRGGEECVGGESCRFNPCSCH